MPEGIAIIASNRRARREYHITETMEAGLALLGTEVKSLRERRASLAEAYCRAKEGEMYLVDAHIAPYSHGSLNNHEPLRPRKLLLHKREIQRLKKATEQKGFTLIPLKLYWRHGVVKAEIGLARGKHHYDKRADIAERDSKRRLDREMKRH